MPSNEEGQAAPRALHARIPVELRCPEGMVGSIVNVLQGEYESGFGGVGVRVLDIGANVGAFSIWAAHRWPGCTIDAYEPDPRTFALLCRNLERYSMVQCHNVAVYPSADGSASFVSRYVGDGEAGIVEALAATFDPAAMDRSTLLSVATLHPSELPKADIVKIDVEGSEAEIVLNADFSSAALILVEFQHARHLETVKAQLSGAFDIILEQRFPWSDLLDRPAYRTSLAGDEYGLVFLLRRGQTRLAKQKLPLPEGPVQKLLGGLRRRGRSARRRVLSASRNMVQAITDRR